MHAGLDPALEENVIDGVRRAHHDVCPPDSFFRLTDRAYLDAEQRERLLEIADKCPVHRTLTSEVDIRTIERRDVDDEPIAQ